MHIFYVFFACTLILFSYSPIQSMAQKEIVPSMYTKEPLTTWPKYVYDNAFPGARYNYSTRPDFQQLLNGAMRITKEEADKEKWPKDKRKITDWLNTVRYVEKSLLKKDVTTWTIRDIEKIMLFLNRLRTDAPGKYRSSSKAWLLEKLSDAEANRYSALVISGGAKNEKDTTFIENNGYVCPEPMPRAPFDLQSRLANLLFVTQKHLEKIKKQKGPKHRSDILAAADYMHVELLALLPFEYGNHRLSRIIDHIILAQHCIRPTPFDAPDHYRNAIHAHLKNPNSTELTKLHAQLLDEIEAFSNSLGMGDAFVLSVRNSSQAEAAAHAIANILQLAANKKSLTSCKKCRASASLLCGGCKTVAYCSKLCQKSDWPIHKKECANEK